MKYICAFHNIEVDDICPECEKDMIPIPKVTIPAAELEAKDKRIAELEAIEKAAQAFMDDHDSDWWQECGDWKDTDEFSDVYPIGLLRAMDRALKGGA